MLDEMDANKFNKTALFNLVDTAEKNGASKLVFIASKANAVNYGEIQKMFAVIDAKPMAEDEVRSVCNSEELERVQNVFGLFELEM